MPNYQVSNSGRKIKAYPRWRVSEM